MTLTNAAASEHNNRTVRAKSSSREMSYDGYDIIASLANKVEALVILFLHTVALLFQRTVVVYRTCVVIVVILFNFKKQ